MDKNKLFANADHNKAAIDVLLLHRMESKFKKKYSFLLLLLGFCFILYGRSLFFNFLSMDDPIHITENPYFHPIKLASFKELWTHAYALLYIPITFTVWGLTAWLSQNILGNISPVFFHGLNILTHGLNVVLVYFLIHALLEFQKKQNQNKRHIQWSAFLGSCFFAFHPIQSAAVAWVSGFKDLSVTTLGLLAFLFYLKPKKSAWVPFGFYLAALLAKPTAVVFSVNAWLLRSALPEKERKPIWHLVLWIFAGGVIIYITQSVQRSGYLPIPFENRLWIMLDSLGFYCSKIFWPLGLSGDHGRTPASVWADAPTLFMFLPLFLGSLLMITSRFLPRNFLRAIAFFLVALMPVSGLIPFMFQGTSSVADYYLYFPMIGLAWGFALLVQANWKYSTLIIASSILVILFVCSWSNLTIWKNNESFYYATVRENPSSSLAHQALGAIEASRGNLAKAREYFEIAVHTRGDITDLSNLASVLDQMNLLNEDEMEHKLKIMFARILTHKDAMLSIQLWRSNSVNIASLLAKIYISHGELHNAVAPLALASEFLPENASLHNKLGQLYKDMGNTAQATAEFSRADAIEHQKA